jgi:hypothetical protein
MMRIKPVVIHQKTRTLVDRRSLAQILERSVNTIRAHCPIAEYRNGRALYDAHHCGEILNGITTRRRRVDQVA